MSVKKIAILFILILPYIMILSCQNKENQKNKNNQPIPKKEKKAEPVKVTQTENELTDEEKSKTRIFILHSYHPEMEWVQEINNGITTVLRKHMTTIATRYFYMDTKRRTSKEWKEEIAQKAIKSIKAFKPAVVIVSDDNATNYVVRKMAGTDYQFVFLGVNADPKDYDLPAPNVTGFLEHENFIQTANLLTEILPNLEKVVFLADKSPSTLGLEKRVNHNKDYINMEILAVKRIAEFEEWKKMIKKYQQEKNTCFILGHYHTIKNKKGETVPAPRVMEWTLKNSNIPEGSFWAFSINQGALCAITVSGYQHGYQATKRALEIVNKKKKAGDYEIKTIRKGEQMLNLLRAKKLGITNIPGNILNKSIKVEKQTALD